MSFRYPKGGFIQLFFDPLTEGPPNEFGPLYAFGANPAGEVGDNTIVAKSSPVQIGTATSWKTPFASAVSSYVITANKELWAWGGNNYGYLAQNDTVYRSSPVQVGALTNWSSVAGKVSALSAIKEDGTMWLWGYGAYGQLGNNSTANVSSPIQLGSGTNWAKSAGGFYTMFGIKTDGTLWAWGINPFGVLGTNTAYGINYSSPVQIGALTNWKEITSGFRHTAAVKTNGTLWTWGNNEFGQLGQNIAYDQKISSPVQVGALTNWSNVSAGQYHCIALKTDGTVWAWGRNLRGELGLNTAYNIYRSSPVQIGALTTWSKIDAGWVNSTAIKTDGTLWSWGRAPVGDNTNINRSSPVQIGTSTSWSNVSAGGYTSTGVILGTQTS